MMGSEDCFHPVPENQELWLSHHSKPHMCSRTSASNTFSPFATIPRKKATNVSVEGTLSHVRNLW